MSSKHLPPEMVTVTETYRAAVITAINDDNSELALSYLQIFNQALPRNYRVEIFKDKAQLDEWLKKEEQSLNHKLHAKCVQGDVPNEEDPVFVFEEKDQHGMNENPREKAFKLLSKIEMQLVKFSEEYVIAEMKMNLIREQKNF